MSKNAEGWIRHRGGKCPVEKGTRVDVRIRNGATGCAQSEHLAWDHYKNDSDIMAYRLHKPDEQVEPDIYAADDSEQSGDVDISFSEPVIVDGPLQWRDRIVTIGFEIHSLTAERAELVQRLAGEGFALIGRVVEPVEDMGDWRNWKVGDQLTTVLENDCNIEIGRIVTLRSIEDAEYDGGMPVSVFYGNEWNWPEAQDESGACVFKWHSRPSA